MIFLKLIFAFLAVWFGLAIFIKMLRKATIVYWVTAVFSGSVCGLLWSFGVFD